MTDDLGIDRRQTIVQPPNNLPYVVAVVVMMALGVMGVVAVTLARPAQDNTVLITAILGFLAPTTLSLLAFMKSQETHLSVNSRLDAFMANAKLAAHARGISEGRAEGRVQADARTDTLARDAHIGAAAPVIAIAPVAAPVPVIVVNDPLTVKSGDEHT